jgi:hypothetical protein
MLSREIEPLVLAVTYDERERVRETRRAMSERNDSGPYRRYQHGQCLEYV